jgi:hypothetical protein
MSTTSDVIKKLPQRARNITTARAVQILTGEVTDDLRYDIFDEFKTTYEGEQIITTTKPGAPGALIADVAVAGDVDNGNYRYKVSLVTSAREGMAGKESPVVNVEDKTVNGQIELTGVPVGGDSTNTTARKVYRQQNGSGDFNLIGTINDNTTTTFTDNIAQSAVGVKYRQGQDLASDYYEWIALMDGNREIPIKRRMETSTDDPQSFAWVDYSDSADDTATQRLNFNEDHPFSGELRLMYYREIPAFTEAGALPFPTKLHPRLLSVLSLGLGYFYLFLDKTGEDDVTARLGAAYENAKANLFAGSISTSK